jgi:hypothetical protein
MTLNVNPKTKQELRAYVSKTLTETFGMFESDIRRYIEERAAPDGKKIIKERLDELTEDLLKYHNELLEGLEATINRKRARRADFSHEPTS